jgi:fructose-1,6-bisphosphatase/inositol monophosphatase family enzyme
MDERESLSITECRLFLEAARKFVVEARNVLCSVSRSSVSVENKNDGSLVTDIDRRVERLLLKLIQKRYPDHGFLGEESGAVNDDAELQWLVDPIDGSEEFVRALPFYGTVLALNYRGRPIAGVIDHPELGICCSAAFGLGAFRNGQRLSMRHTPNESIGRKPLLVIPAREDFVQHVDESAVFNQITAEYPNHRIFRTCYGHTCVVLGYADAAIEYSVRAWDLAATQLLIEEAGGRYEQIREVGVPAVGRFYGAVFGEQRIVNCLSRLLMI